MRKTQRAAVDLETEDQAILWHQKTNHIEKVRFGINWELLLFSPVFGLGPFARNLDAFGWTFVVLDAFLFLSLAFEPKISLLVMFCFVPLQIFIGIFGNKLIFIEHRRRGYELLNRRVEEKIVQRWGIDQAKIQPRGSASIKFESANEYNNIPKPPPIPQSESEKSHQELVHEVRRIGQEQRTIYHINNFLGIVKWSIIAVVALSIAWGMESCGDELSRHFLYR